MRKLAILLPLLTLITATLISCSSREVSELKEATEPEPRTELEIASIKPEAGEAIVIYAYDIEHFDVNIGRSFFVPHYYSKKLQSDPRPLIQNEFYPKQLIFTNSWSWQKTPDPTDIKITTAFKPTTSTIDSELFYYRASFTAPPATRENLNTLLKGDYYFIVTNSNGSHDLFANSKNFDSFTIMPNNNGYIIFLYEPVDPRRAVGRIP